MKDDPHSDVPVKTRDKEPGTEVKSWDEPGNAVPHLWWCAVGRRLVHEVDLGSAESKAFWNTRHAAHNVPAAQIRLELAVGRIKVGYCLEVFLG